MGFLSFPRRGDSVVFAGLEQAQNLAGKDIRRPISDPFSRCRVCGKLSQIVKAIRRKRESQMSIRERAAVGARGYKLRQKPGNGWLSLPRTEYVKIRNQNNEKRIGLTLLSKKPAFAAIHPAMKLVVAD
jgi:hypothetical protein